MSRETTGPCYRPTDKSMRRRSKPRHLPCAPRRSCPVFALAVASALALASTATTAAYAQGKAPVAAAAQTPQARAAELFSGGADAYRRGDFKEAVSLLREAYSLDPQPVLLYNLGRAYEDLGEGDHAIETFTQYLNEDPKAPDRGAIEQRIETLRRQRDERVALEKQRDAQRARAEKAERERNQRDAARSRQRSIGPYILGGIGVVGIGTGVVLGLAAKSKHDDASQPSTSQQDAIDQQDTAKSFATISTISLVAGIVFVASGATWWFIDRKASTSKHGATDPSSFRVGLAPGFVFLERGLP